MRGVLVPLKNGVIIDDLNIVRPSLRAHDVCEEGRVGMKNEETEPRCFALDERCESVTETYLQELEVYLRKNLYMVIIYISA